MKLSATPSLVRLRHLAQCALYQPRRARRRSGVDGAASASAPLDVDASIERHRHRFSGSRYASARVVSEPRAPTAEAAATAARRGTPAREVTAVSLKSPTRSRTRDARASGADGARGRRIDVPIIAAPHTTAIAAMFARARVNAGAARRRRGTSGTRRRTRTTRADVSDSNVSARPTKNHDHIVRVFVV